MASVDINGGSLTSSRQRQPFPYYGIDIGGTLLKLVYFEPLNYEDGTGKEIESLKSIRETVLASVAYGGAGVRDEHLEIKGIELNNFTGNMHFLRFPVQHMDSFAKMAKEFSSMHNICHVTGGGAFRFEHKFRNDVNVKFNKLDEMECLIKGIHFLNHNAEECFSIDQPRAPGHIVKLPYNFKNPYPYIVCNIGTGVGIMVVNSLQDFRIVSGTNFGGGSFFGLCCLLTGCETFDEAIQLAAAGDNTKVDKLVGDIYGGDYDKFGYSGKFVAARFGKMNEKEYRDAASKEDLAAAILQTITDNIGSAAKRCALEQGINKVVFVGNFLRENHIAMKMLAYAIDVRSDGKLKALFLQHEGYFGAVGALQAVSRTTE